MRLLGLLDWSNVKPSLERRQLPLLVSSALSPQTWPFSLEWLPETACLVGGSVRDAMLGRRRDYLDLDFVLPTGAVETAQAIARHYRAGYVLLDAERQIARVVFPQGTADFAQQVGDCLEADLWRRDFTVNAIAYNPHQNEILDPLGGCADLEQRLIRMVSPANLAEDPLRLLRAYRQAAQLNFAIAPDTRTEIRQLAARLATIAAERVQSELNYLLSDYQGGRWLQAAWHDGLLQTWLPAATESRLHWLLAIDQALAVLQGAFPELAQLLTSHLQNPTRGINYPLRPDAAHLAAVAQPSGSTRTWLSLAKLTSLIDTEIKAAETQLRRLKYSRHEIQAILTILKALPTLMPLATQPRPTPPIAHASRTQCLFFQEAGPTFPAVALLAIAAGVPLDEIAPLIQRFLTPGDPVAYPTALVSGQDLIQRLNLTPGPHIGHLLAEMQLAHAEGKIHTPEEAIQLAKELQSELA